jgi:hypothetical protein
VREPEQIDGGACYVANKLNSQCKCRGIKLRYFDGCGVTDSAICNVNGQPVPSSVPWAGPRFTRVAIGCTLPNNVILIAKSIAIATHEGAVARQQMAEVN